MPRPQPAPTALGARPAHPFSPPPTIAAEPAAAPALEPAVEPAVESARNFSTRLTPALQRRVKRHAIDTDASVQDVVAAALTEYLDKHEQ